MALDNIKCPLGNWYYIVGSWSDPLNRMQIFGNGELKDTYIETSSMPNSNYHFTIGYKDDYGNYYDGIMDEVRISNIERNYNWIKTSYNNQYEPNSLISISPEVNIP